MPHELHYTSFTPLAPIIITIILILLPLHRLHLHLSSDPPLPILTHQPILAPLPQIFERQLLGASQTLNRADTLQRRFQKVLEARLAADFLEGALHGNRVGAHHGAGVDAENGEVVVLADEVGARHDPAGAVEGDRGEDVALGGRVGFVHIKLGFIEGVGEDHGCGLDKSHQYD